MNKTKLLAMILVFCMVFSNLAMSASAVAAPVDSVGGSTVESKDIVAENDKSSSGTSDLVVSGDSAASSANTLKNAEVVKSELVDTTGTVSSAGTWTITPTDAPGASLLQQETPACLEELKQAAEVFEHDEVVHAFVVMEDAPLADTHTSPALVSAYVEKQMIEKQNEVISNIERTVLHGSELKVRYQFTYLTNSFSIETEFENLEKIAAISGVKSVFIMPVYNAIPTDEAVSNPNTVSAADMTGVDQVREEFGYTGAGMKIAIIDTGLDLDHPSFAADPVTTDDSLTVKDIETVLGTLNVSYRNDKVTADDLYRTAKVPFAFNYCDDNLTADHSKDSQGDHGTHVAGIAAANDVEGSGVVGMAPDAQIIVMKVFGANGGAYTDDIVAALEDAMTLGCDVVNASLGSAAGFTTLDSEYDLIYQRLASQDIVACISAGNEGTSSYDNMWGTDMNRTSNPDNATVGQPGIFENVMTVASAGNAVVMGDYYTVGDTKIFYMDSYEYMLGTVSCSLRDLAGKNVEYVIVPGLGTEEDFAQVDVSGKVAIVSRGELAFYLKAKNAEDNGAVACIIWNNNDEDDIYSFGMNTTDTETSDVPSIPVSLISLADGQIMADAEDKTMTVATEMAGRPSASGGQMSSFSSWGVSPDLGLEPDITGIGGNVYSCLDGGTYGLMSGTSMSSPQVAGVTALVMQRLKELYPNAVDGTIRELAEALLMSTADPIISTGSGLEASPRQQGAGLVNAYKAVTSTVYLTVGGEKPKAELGDSSTGKFSFSFEIHNIGTEAVTYTLDSSLLTELAEEIGGVYFMSGEEMELSSTVTFDKNSVTVPAGGKADVIARIELSEEDIEYFQTAWPNGGYVEGYIYLVTTSDEGVVSTDLSLPFLGFYGDWTEAPVFDTAYWYENSFWGEEPVDGMPEGDEYFHVFWTSLAGTDWVLGMNPYAGSAMDKNGQIIYDPANNVVSPNGDGIIDGIDEIYLSLLRNAKTLTFTYTVGDEVVHRETYTNNSKTMYNSAYGQVVPWLFSWQSSEMYDFTDAKGETLPDGTQVVLTIDATVDYGTGGDHSIQIPILIDTTPPELLEVKSEEVDGKAIMTLTVSDSSLAAVLVMNHSGTRTYAKAYDYQLTANEDGTYTVECDITNFGTEFTVAVCDYGGNESYFEVVYEDENGNLPELTEGQLFAYRVYDSQIYSDHMYGWVELNLEKTEANEEEGIEASNDARIEVWTDDYLEYASLVAAEYVDGKIFAVDAVYNLVVLDPGLFDRNTVCNLGVNVLDMTFDDSTDTMYVLSKSGYYTSLYTMDLLTGELTEVKYYGYYTYGPWAITDDDNGTLYAIKYNGSNLYTIDPENGYVMETIKDADGNALVVKESNGTTDVKPVYAQSIAYNEGVLYWAYYRSTWAGSSSNLLTFNLADQTMEYYTYVASGYNSDYELVDYTPTTELNGLLFIRETDYTIPGSDEIISVTPSVDSLLMKVGDTQTVSATSLPWNYDVKEVTWISSDEKVATVDNGKIRAVGEGHATITVTMDGISATIDVQTVAVSGSFYAYNYYSADYYYGTIIRVDMEDMDYSLGMTVPVDFLAGEYNGHNGLYYGYAESGQLYSWDMETNECKAVGVAQGSYPVDMAYDYSTGIMYAMFTDLSTYESKLAMVNLHTGAVVTVCNITYDYYIMGGMTLACDSNGTLYFMDFDGTLYSMNTSNYEINGPVSENLMELGSIMYAQSMCWDYTNNVLIWAYADGVSINWINVEEGYMLELGDPTESGAFEFMSLFTVPAEIPELPYVAVDEVEANDMTLVVGVTTVADINVYPFNATNQDLVLVSSNTDVVTVADGMVTTVSAGEATVTYTLVDGEKTYSGSIKVTSVEAADNIRAFLMSDLATGYGQIWMELHPENPAIPTAISAADYVIYAAEKIGDKVYGYGYDANDWEANWQYLTMDPDTYDILEQKEMAVNFPFVYDMTYDYATNSVYCVAGSGSEDLDLYLVNQETGEVTLLLDTEQNFMSITAGRDGYLYAVENSIGEYDPLEWTTVYSNANLYKINVKTLEVTKVGDTGIASNMLGTLAYDYDTDTIYWAWLFRDDMWAYKSGFCMVDPETAETFDMGMISTAGAQVTCMMIDSENKPAAVSGELYNVLLNPTKTSMNVGTTTKLSLNTIPVSIDGAQITWRSSNKSVATVNGSGVVTAVGEGKATITATVSYNGTTLSATTNIAVLSADASFLSWNQTDMGWSQISRVDYSVTNLTEGEEAGISAVAAVGEDVYGFGLDNVLFKLNDDYTRTIIGEDNSLKMIKEFMEYSNASSYKVTDFNVEIRDMAYDPVSEQMLVLLGVQLYDEWFDAYAEAVACNYICSVDLTTGELTTVFHIEELYNNYALTCSPYGDVYFYSGYDGTIYNLDLVKQTYSSLVSLQSVMVYPDFGDGVRMSMHYDTLTDAMYLISSQNAGKAYMMCSVDASTGSITYCDDQGDYLYVGDVQLSNWAYRGDAFTGLFFVGEVSDGNSVDTDVVRLAGENRFDTAMKVADELKKAMEVDSFNAIVVASGSNFPDALTGSYLAIEKDAPVLLYSDVVGDEVAAYICENISEGGVVYILGGTAAISAELDETLAAAGVETQRLAGENRLDTNMAILSEAGVAKDQEILICTAFNYADALTAAATGLPVMLVGNELTDAQREFLNGHTGKVTVIGGTTAVSEEIATELNASRISGANRYDTSVMIAHHYFGDAANVILADGLNFPDGLSGSVLSAKLNAPLVLVNDGYASYADSYVENALTGYVLGGTARISDSTVRDVFELSADAEIVVK